jgi:cytoskeletal protein CcmA (bactofilin family)
MFKKFNTTSIETPSISDRPMNPFASDLMNALDASTHEEPETTIADGITIKGSIEFKKILRIDGVFEGELISSGKLIVGPTGVVKANITLEEAFISGRVEGNITVTSRLCLRGRASIQGDIQAPLLSIDEGVSLKGSLTVAQAPSTEEHFGDTPLDDHYHSDN